MGKHKGMKLSLFLKANALLVWRQLGFTYKLLSVLSIVAMYLFASC